MGYTELGINVSNFIDSYRNIGYSMETAIADIIDNSIYAKATIINVNMIDYDDFWKGPSVQIIDNGFGMSDSELRESMRLACKSPNEVRDPSDLGRYGLGLKSASFSQCRIMTVCSKKDNQLTCKQWNLDHVKEVNRFEIEECAPESYNCEDIIKTESGTAVIWSQMDALASIFDISDNDKKEAAWIKLKNNVYNHIAITYSGFAKDIYFYFNGNRVEMWDPFALDNTLTKEIADEYINVANDKVRIRSYLLPNKLAPKEMEKLAFNSSMNEMQGFYIYRNNRLIKYGTWLGLNKLTKKEAFRLARIRIDIGNTMDDLWHIDIKKENAICPSELTEKLLSYAKNARRVSSSVFRSKGKTLRRDASKSDYTFLWNYRTKDEKPVYEINRKNPVISGFCDSLDSTQLKQFKSILKFIENYIPVMSILEAESSSNGKYFENTPSEIKDTEIEQSFWEAVDTLESTMGVDREEAINICKCIEPYSNHVALIDKIISEEVQK